MFSQTDVFYKEDINIKFLHQFLIFTQEKENTEIIFHKSL